MSFVEFFDTSAASSGFFQTTQEDKAISHGINAEFTPSKWRTLRTTENTIRMIKTSIREPGLSSRKHPRKSCCRGNQQVIPGSEEKMIEEKRKEFENERYSSSNRRYDLERECYDSRGVHDDLDSNTENSKQFSIASVLLVRAVEEVDTD